MITSILAETTDLGLRIRQIRKRHLDMTQAELAKALNLSRPMTVSDWERGEYPPSRERLEDIAKLAGIELSEITGDPRAGEETPEQAAAYVLPDVSYLKPAARAYYDRMVGSWFTRGWPIETIERTARELVAPIKGYSVLRRTGQGYKELTDEDQIVVMEDQAETIESEYGPNGILRR